MKLFFKILSAFIIFCSPISSWEVDSTPVQQSPVKQHIISLMSRLCAATGTQYRLHFMVGDYAFDSGNDVYVNAGWLAHYSDPEIMLILGHEMGHNEEWQYGGGKQAEYNADVYGAKLLLKIHYTREQVMQAAALFLRSPFSPIESENSTHPSGPHRYENIKNKL